MMLAAAVASWPNAVIGRWPFAGCYLDRVKELLGEVIDDRRASLVTCLLSGLAGGLQTLRLLDDSDADWVAVIEEHGALLPAMLDASGPSG